MHVPPVAPIRPKITIANIPLSILPEALISSIRRKNSSLTSVPSSEMDVLFINQSRYKITCAVLALSPSVRSLFLQLGDRVFVELRSCPVYDRFWVARCGRCSGIGHKTNSCDRSTSCSHCAGSHKLLSSFLSAQMLQLFSLWSFSQSLFF